MCVDRPYYFSAATATWLRFAKAFCTSGESNSGLVRGKDLCYHYTTSAVGDVQVFILPIAFAPVLCLLVSSRSIMTLAAMCLIGLLECW